VGSIAPQFAGYEQQDAQELMGFVIDGLHEDLNCAGNNDPAIPERAWEQHIQKNDSPILPIFHGQLKSNWQCSKCGKVTVVFESVFSADSSGSKRA
jgi:ubiquitin C-terminal hydrolase